MKKSLVGGIFLVLVVGVTGYFTVDYLSKPRVVSAETENVISCVDSDGYNIYESGITEYTYFFAGETKLSTLTDVCNYNHEKTKTYVGLVRDSYCEGGQLKTDWLTCGWGSVCRGGACVSEDSNTPICKDTDGGENIAVSGSVSGYGGTGEDRCVYVLPDGSEGTGPDCSGNTCYVGEYFCNGDQKDLKNIPCPSGCLNGACIQ